METSRPQPTARAVVLVLAYCGGLVSLTQSVALPLLHDLPDLLHASVGDVSWVSTAALLGGAVANPVLGKLGDMYGKRSVMLGALAALLVGSVIAAVSPSVWPLVIGRALQGVSIAVLPISMALAKDLLAPQKVIGAVAMISAMLGIGGGIALPMAGVMLDLWGWQSVFWASAVMALAGIVLAAIVLPRTERGAREPFDVTGAVLLSVALVSLLLPLSKSSKWGFAQPLPLALYAVGFIGLFAWFRWEQHPAVPLVNIDLMRQRPLLVTNIVGVLLGFGMFNNNYVSIFLLQAPKAVSHGFDTSVMMAGLVLLPAALAMMFMSPVSARISTRYGGRTALWIGALAIGTSFIARPFMVGSIWQIGLGVAMVNCGVGIAYGAMPAVVMSYVPANEAGSANALGTLTRSTGASISSAAFAALLSSLTTLHDGEQVARLIAFQIAFGMSAVLALAAAALAFSLPRTPSILDQRR
ncbi:MAG: MFS transporter [Actinobacteria bacterium]|uniref:Unannotated protein n=1 Tax=freshwater metagenome TaxID=449393 RepID=A0A6J7BQ83_9ZZZZ|nr:MFS transporter [Actinomycetota bacterium]